MILNGLLHEIFSALPAISEENREQTINFSYDRQRIKRENQGEKSIGGKYLRNLFTHLEEYNQYTREAIASKQRMSSAHYQLAFDVPILISFPETCQENNFR